MRILILTSLFLFLSISSTNSQVTLSANGKGDTYALINGFLTPNYASAIEVPDCGHATFGKHIDEVYDATLQKYVFRFMIHVNEDSDRCKNYDRQRNEIKANSKSPENLLARKGASFIYTWKMKLDTDFKASPNFTHLHQLKSVGGPFSGKPLFSLTAEKKKKEEFLAIKYAQEEKQITLKKIDLHLLKGHWVEITEKVTYGVSPSYSLDIKRIVDQKSLVSYSQNHLNNWKTKADYVRPKWGICRSLKKASYLRDEEVLFADFKIEQINDTSLKASK